MNEWQPARTFPTHGAVDRRRISAEEEKRRREMVMQARSYEVDDGHAEFLRGLRPGCNATKFYVLRHPDNESEYIVCEHEILTD